MLAYLPELAVLSLSSFRLHCYHHHGSIPERCGCAIRGKGVEEDFVEEGGGDLEGECGWSDVTGVLLPILGTGRGEVFD